MTFFSWLLLVLIFILVLDTWIKARFLVKEELLRMGLAQNTVTQDLLQFLIKKAKPSETELENFLAEKKKKFEELTRMNNQVAWLAAYNSLEEAVWEVTGTPSDKD